MKTIKRLLKFRKTQADCTLCEVGKLSYELDDREPVCPYISSYQNKQCAFFVPIVKKKRKARN